MAGDGVRVLVTAFGAFPGSPVNPTLQIVQKLQQAPSARLHRLGIELVTAVLPVVYGDSRGRLQRLFADVRPDLVIHLGLAARRKVICIETRGVNRRSTLRVGADKRLPATATVEQGAPHARTVDLATAAMVQTMTATGAPTRLSIDAGDYVCNETIYLATGLHPAAGFIHVPRPRSLRRPVGDKRDLPPPVAAMTEAVMAAIVLAASRKRNRDISQRLLSAT